MGRGNKMMRVVMSDRFRLWYPIAVGLLGAVSVLFGVTFDHLLVTYWIAAALVLPFTPAFFLLVPFVWFPTAYWFGEDLARVILPVVSGVLFAGAALVQLAIVRWVRRRFMR